MVNELEERLSSIKLAETCPLACIGSVYLDTLVDGIDLADDQHILDFRAEIPVEIESRPGGSAYFVAYYLHNLGKVPTIISVIGKDENGDTFWKIAERETSSDALGGIIRTDQGKTAVTINFISPNPKEKTAMYTDRDVLRLLKWKDVSKKLINNHCNNGVVYISGIFKTGMHRALAQNLTKLKNRGAIICLDHGRLHLEQHTSIRRRSLQEALPLVDIYFTTRDEFSQVLSLVAPKHRLINKLADVSIQLNDAVPQIIQEANFDFPPIMIIHDTNSQSPMRLIVIRQPNNKIHYSIISIKESRKLRQPYVGIGNIFQAIFINELISSTNHNIYELVYQSALKAQRCLEWVCERMGRTVAGAVQFWSELSKSIPLVENTPLTSSATQIEIFQNMLRQRCSINDLHEICLALNIDYENLAGEAKGRKIDSLLKHLEHRQKLDSLIKWLQRQRPDIKINDS